MRDEKRIKKILGILEEIWARNPDQRLGQLLINLGIAKDEIHTWLVEDDLMEKHLFKIKKTKKPM